MKYPRCHQCGTFGYLPGVFGTFRVKLSNPKSDNFYDKVELTAWKYCDCKAGEFLKTYHDLMLSLVNGKETEYVVPIKRGQKLEKDRNPFPLDDRFKIYSAPRY